MKLQMEITRQDYIDFNTFRFMKTRLKPTVIVGLSISAS